MNSEPVRTVQAVLERLESSFSEFTEAFNRGQYVMWLGSGISRDRVPSVGVLLGRVVEHLRANVVHDSEDCPYRTALDEVLRLANLDSDDLVGIDYSLAFDHWPLRNRIVDSLVTRYSSVLDVSVGDQLHDDYLAWTGLDIPNTYGSPELEPDVEHYCIAVLMLEGLVESAVTANWDGLLEKALQAMTPAFGSLVRVAVKPDDFRGPSKSLEVLKFHGCAVRAREDEAEYRQLLVARASQVSGWSQQPRNTSMRRRMEFLYTNRRTLMLGLSAQDPNLHTVFAEAVQNLAWPWPGASPAVVLSEERLESHHKTVLSLTYGPNHSLNASAIKESALLGAYGKPTLLGLVLASLTEKMTFLLKQVESSWFPMEVAELQNDLIRLRDLAAKHADPEDRENLEHDSIVEFQREFATRLIKIVNLALLVFRTGKASVTGTAQYVPVSRRPVVEAVLDADFPTEQFGRLGISLGLIGRGLRSGDWTVGPGTEFAPEDGIVRLTTDHRTTPVFFVRDAATLTRLELNGLLDDSDGNVLVVVADKEPPTQTRSPKSRFGRVGKASLAKFNVASSMADTTSLEDLYETFKLTGGF